MRDNKKIVHPEYILGLIAFSCAKKEILIEIKRRKRKEICMRTEGVLDKRKEKINSYRPEIADIIFGEQPAKMDAQRYK